MVGFGVLGVSKFGRGKNRKTSQPTRLEYQTIYHQKLVSV